MPHVLERVFALSINRIKFIKDESVKFISHLDMMKAFQRAIRRAGLEAEYSHGFNPQMQMVFGAPLSLGFTSEAEYADLSFSRDYKSEFIMEELNKALSPGLQVVDSGIRTTKKNIMADISFARYEFNLRSSVSIEKNIRELLSSDNLPVEKTRKGKTKTIDVRPLIMEADAAEGKMRILVSAGNMNNLNPMLLVEAMKAGIDSSIEGDGYNRIEQFVERNGKMTDPLSKEALETK